MADAAEGELSPWQLLCMHSIRPGATAIELYEPPKTPGQDGRETGVITDIITLKAK